MLVDAYAGLAGFLGLAGTVIGRKKLQKAIYLAQELGFPGLEIRFDYYLFGPYSEALAAKVAELVLLGALSEEKRETAGGFATYSYSLTDQGRKVFAEKIEAVRRYQTPVQMLMESDARFLELAATLRFFLKHRYTPHQAIEEVQARKPEQGYSRSECEKAIAFLAELERAFQEGE